ncbi:hypothetical protein F5J12DRAFT_683500, partial [Pisolithus orientalis]|uniref:uncharacterized protein n=1 Tax=Pisolithus orientalis TaxID=936130 RepID=UPI002224C427
EKKAILEWSKSNTVMEDILCCCFSPTVLFLIPQECSTTAHDVWKTLHDTFDHVDVGLHHLVHAKILHLQMKDASNATCYLSEHSAAHQDLICMRVPYTDEEAIFHLIEGLLETG